MAFPFHMLSGGSESDLRRTASWSNAFRSNALRGAASCLVAALIVCPLAACDSGAPASDSTPTEPQPPSITAFAPAEDAYEAGTAARFQWDTDHTSRCTFDPNTSTDGDERPDAPTSATAFDHTYYRVGAVTAALTCEGDGGTATASADLTLEAADPVRIDDLRLDPQDLVRGENLSVTAVATNYTRCAVALGDTTLADVPSGAAQTLSTAGFALGELTATASCSGPGATGTDTTVTRSATATIQPRPAGRIESFTIAPSEVEQGTPVYASLTSSGVEDCVLKTPNGTAAVSSNFIDRGIATPVVGEFTASVECVGPDGTGGTAAFTASDTYQVIPVDEAPAITNFTVSPDTVAEGSAVRLTAEATDDNGISAAELYVDDVFRVDVTSEAASIDEHIQLSGLGDRVVELRVSDTADQAVQDAESVFVAESIPTTIQLYEVFGSPLVYADGASPTEWIEPTCVVLRRGGSVVLDTTVTGGVLGLDLLAGEYSVSFDHPALIDDLHTLMTPFGSGREALGTTTPFQQAVFDNRTHPEVAAYVFDGQALVDVPNNEYFNPLDESPIDHLRFWLGSQEYDGVVTRLPNDLVVGGGFYADVASDWTRADSLYFVDEIVPSIVDWHAHRLVNPVGVSSEWYDRDVLPPSQRFDRFDFRKNRNQVPGVGTGTDVDYSDPQNLDWMYVTTKRSVGNATLGDALAFFAPGTTDQNPLFCNGTNESYPACEDDPFNKSFSLTAYGEVLLKAYNALLTGSEIGVRIIED